ncbi:GTP cyclohydrolase I FolE [Candidiatus Paracoxiella cheracis]|uniref:GTP cyclohydrolase I FolE n=1 Tax=Candidiatus Paracoxiella cheracis TaxID=3405120 RepID=UPI003BF4BDBD
MTTKPIENYVTDILTILGENPNREGLKETPRRFRKALEHLTKGYGENIDTIVNDALFESDMDEMVIVKNIELYSLCEHHLLPFVGKCHVAYLPNGKILGLSKIARIVDMFAKRLQVQEHLTKQIAETILSVTDAKGVGVIIEAKHLCMMMRGVEKQHSDMTTSMMLGRFRQDDRTRAEFLSLIKGT